MPNAKSVSNSNSNNLSNSNNQNNAHSSPKDMLIDEETNRVINQIENNDVVNNDVVNYILCLHRDATLQHHWVQDPVDIYNSNNLYNFSNLSNVQLARLWDYYQWGYESIVITFPLNLEDCFSELENLDNSLDPN